MEMEITSKEAQLLDIIEKAKKYPGLQERLYAALYAFVYGTKEEHDTLCRFATNEASREDVDPIVKKYIPMIHGKELIVS